MLNFCFATYWGPESCISIGFVRLHRGRPTALGNGDWDLLKSKFPDFVEAWTFEGAPLYKGRLTPTPPPTGGWPGKASSDKKTTPTTVTAAPAAVVVEVPLVVSTTSQPAWTTPEVAPVLTGAPPVTTVQAATTAAEEIIPADASISSPISAQAAPEIGVTPVAEEPAAVVAIGAVPAETAETDLDYRAIVRPLVARLSDEGLAEVVMLLELGASTVEDLLTVKGVGKASAEKILRAVGRLTG